MKKLLSKFTIAIAFIGLICCSNTCTETGSTSNGENVLGTPSMTIGYTMQATRHQIDSICVADTLPNFNKWLGQEFKDYETGEVIIKKMYVKTRNGYEATYIVNGKNEPYTVTQRIKR